MARIYEIHTGRPAAERDTGAQTYFEVARIVERMHRRFLDVLRIEMGRLGVNDISSAQAMILLNMGEGEIGARDLMTRGYYLGSNASYNLKQLVEAGYVERTSAARDKRQAVLRLSEKGAALVADLRGLVGSLAGGLDLGGGEKDALDGAYQTLRRLERQWSDFIQNEDPLD